MRTIWRTVTSIRLLILQLLKKIVLSDSFRIQIDVDINFGSRFTIWSIWCTYMYVCAQDLYIILIYKMQCLFYWILKQRGFDYTDAIAEDIPMYVSIILHTAHEWRKVWFIELETLFCIWKAVESMLYSYFRSTFILIFYFLVFQWNDYITQLHIGKFIKFVLVYYRFNQNKPSGA